MLATALGLSPFTPGLAQQSATSPPAGAAITRAQPALPPTTAADQVDPKAREALRRMSAFLGTLNGFEMRADSTLDLVTVSGQRVQLGGVSQYKVRKPNGFQIDLTTDYMDRRYFFDGKQFTVFAPKLGFYATAAAPPTIRETLDVIEERYDISLPLADLFRWNDPKADQEEPLTTAFLVGPAVVDGVTTDHYAFRQQDRDWEVWIQQGAQPLPLKLVIVDRTDEARPGYTARLKWTLNPAIPADVFTFRPTPDAKAIRLATLNP